MKSTHYSCWILMKLESFDRFSKEARVSSFIQIRPVEAELFHADVKKLIVTFHNFANAPKNGHLNPSVHLAEIIYANIFGTNVFYKNSVERINCTFCAQHVRKSGAPVRLGDCILNFCA